MIRLIKKEDVKFINEVRNECREWLHDSSFYTYEEALDWFEKNKDLFFIYELEGKRIGYFRTSNWKDDSCYIGMDIHKDFRGKKLSVPAFKEFMKLLNRDYNIGKFKLEVLTSNDRARSLYKKLGFKFVAWSTISHTEEKLSMVMEKSFK
jgi:RimJ/RimL family protein N-acetyltransferase